MTIRMQFILVLSIFLAFGAQASGQSSLERDALESEIRIERALIEVDLEQHEQFRNREKAYRNQIAEIERQIDAMLDQEPFALEEIEILDDTLAAARRAAHGVAGRADEIRQRIYARWRRVALLDLEMAQRTETDIRGRDPVSGEWTVQMLPSGNTGRFDLELDGTLVSGTYELAGGQWGSLRGTFVGNTLRLERVDARFGFDLVLEGMMSDDRQRLDGTWVATLLTSGGPGNGHWSIQRAERRGEEGE